MKRRIHATVMLEYWVDLDIDDEEQVCADPDGEMSDADAAELAISSAFGAQKHEVQVFGPNIEPAIVFREHADVRIRTPNGKANRRRMRPVERQVRQRG